VSHSAFAAGDCTPQKWHYLALSGTVSGVGVADLKTRQRLTLLGQPISATFRRFIALTGTVLRMIPSRNIKVRNDFGGHQLSWHWRVDLLCALRASEVSH